MSQDLSVTGRVVNWRQLLRALPRGVVLPEAVWQSRHRYITLLLWAHVAALPVIGVLRGQQLDHALLESTVVGILAVGASMPRLSVTTRSSMATLGLVTCSAVLVHIHDGLIEMHFHFFVVVAVVALYQAWLPFLLALGFVVLHHTVMGVLAPDLVYNHPDAQMHPWIWALIHGFFILAESITCLIYWRISEDALDRERVARSGLEKAHQELTRAQAMSRVGNWDWDITSNRVTWSDQLYALTGMDKGFQPSVSSYLEMIHPDDRDRVRTLIDQAVETTAGLDYEARLVRADGQVRIIHALSDLKVADGGLTAAMFGTIHDVTEWRLLQGEIEHLAFHDPLTGLANRRLFMDRLEHALAVHERTGHGCAVLFLDLDDFKLVNDSLGHSAGDEVLRIIATRLEAGVRAVDTVARLGGDEFAILMENADLTAATRLFELLETRLQQPFRIKGADRFFTCSIGVAASTGGISADEIMSNADAAMYAVKITGKDTGKNTSERHPVADGSPSLSA